MLTTYRNYKPSAFDSAGLGLPYQRDWLVAPVSHSRDSDLLSESNWDAQIAVLKAVDADGDDWEIHRFGHWACGWFEIVIVRPESECAAKAEELAASLSDYPVLNDEDFSEREREAYEEYWSNGDAQRELVRQLRCSGWVEWEWSLELIESGDAETVQVWFEGLIPSGDYYDSDCYPRIQYVVEQMDRKSLALLVKSLRKSASTT